MIYFDDKHRAARLRQEIRVRPDPVGGEGPLSGAEHRDALTLRRRDARVRKQPLQAARPARAGKAQPVAPAPRPDGKRLVYLITIQANCITFFKDFSVFLRRVIV